MKKRVAALMFTCALSAVPALGAEVSLPAFYAAATQLKPEGALGQVLAREAIPTSITGAQAWRIAYISSDVRDRKTISTGLVIAPEAAPPQDGRPILAWSHGTTGTAQNCGPSQVSDPAQNLNEYFLVGGTSWTDFGLPAAAEFIAAGYVLVATDYQGLGGGGKHQYAIAATQGRDVINSIRAAGSLGLSGAGRRAAVYGWSQGGGSTLAAASLSEYIGQKNTAFDNFEVVGFVAMAPDDIAAVAPKGPLDDATSAKLMQGLIAGFSDNIFNFTHFAMNMWAMEAAFPELKLTDVFTVDGAKAVDEIMSKKCMHAASDTMSFSFSDTYKSLLKPEPSNTKAWASAMIEGSVEPKKPVAPVIVYWGTKDTVVPPVMGQLYQQQMCAIGGNVHRVQLPGEQSHFTTPGVSQPMFLPWIKNRFAGAPLENGCPR
ncbi:MAG: alpha/beta fold hydrolase [Beijerinckiaceae bacterium]|nr:alpha/beta fold hydrolase [Beijerinckiaceae bacterium]